MIRSGLALLSLIFISGCNLFDNSIKGELSNSVPIVSPGPPAPPPATGNATIAKQYVTPIGVTLTYSAQNFRSLQGSSKSLAVTSIDGVESLFLLDNASGSTQDLLLATGGGEVEVIYDVSDDNQNILLCGSLFGKTTDHIFKFNITTKQYVQLTDDILFNSSCSSDYAAKFDKSEQNIIFIAQHLGDVRPTTFSVPTAGGAILPLTNQSVFLSSATPFKYDPLDDYIIIGESVASTFKFSAIHILGTSPNIDLTGSSLNGSTYLSDLTFLPNSPVRRYVYTLDEDVSGRKELYASDFDGSNKIKLNNGSTASAIYRYAIGAGPTKKVAFSDTDSIYIVDNDGSNRITLEPGFAGGPLNLQLFYNEGLGKVVYTLDDFSGSYNDKKIFSIQDDGLSPPTQISHTTAANESVDFVVASELRNQIIYSVIDYYDNTISIWETDYTGSFHQKLAPGPSGNPLPQYQGGLGAAFHFIDAKNTLVYLQNKMAYYLDLQSSVVTQISPDYSTGSGVESLHIGPQNNYIEFSGQFNFYENTSYYSYGLVEKSIIQHLGTNLQISSPYFATVNMGTEVVYEDKGESEIHKALYLYNPDQAQTIKITPPNTLSIDSKSYNSNKTWIIFFVTSGDANLSGGYSYNIKDKLGPFKVTPSGLYYDYPPYISHRKDSEELVFGTADQGDSSGIRQTYITGYKGENFQKISNFPTSLINASISLLKNDFTYSHTLDVVGGQVVYHVYVYSAGTGWNDFDSRNMYNGLSIISLEEENRILYSGAPSSVSNPHEIMIADLDGTNRSTIISSSSKMRVIYLKDQLPGSKILYRSDHLAGSNGSKEEYIVMDLDGSNQSPISGTFMANEKLTNYGEVLHSASQRMLFETVVDKGLPNEYELLYSTDFAGNRTLLSPTGVTSGSTSYFSFADQDTVLFKANYEDSNTTDLYKIDSDGSNRIKLNPSLGPEDSLKSFALISNDYVTMFIYSSEQNRNLLYSTNIRTGEIQQLYTDSRGTDLIYSVSSPTKNGKYMFFMASDWENPENISLFYRTPHLSP